MFQPLEPDITCNDRAHYPPSHIVFFQAGHWICPACGHKTYIPGPPIC